LNHALETLTIFYTKTSTLIAGSESFNAYMETDDTRLMLGVKQGEEICMDLLCKRYRGPVIQYIYRLIGNRAIAEELAQCVFLRIYCARASYQPTAKFTSWLFRIANHLALNWKRDHRRECGVLSLSAGLQRDSERPFADRRPTAEQMLLHHARLEEVRQAVQTLPHRQRAAVVMQRYKELEYTEIAEAMNCSPKTVKSLIFRAHHKLRTQLAA
jgi:RNA polymerase sigma-70 factor (ECF subfamily)